MRKISMTLMIVMAVLLAACAPAATPAPAQPTPVPVDNQATVDASVAATMAAQPPPPTAAPTQAPPTPGPTLDPNMPVAVVPTPAPGEPAAIASYNTIIYSGPGESYVVYAAFLGGAQAKVIGKSEDGLWWVISVPPAPLGQGWVSGAAVAVTGADGVPVVPTPPVPPTTELVPPGPEDPQGTVTRQCVRTHRPRHELPGLWHCPGRRNRLDHRQERGQHLLDCAPQPGCGWRRLWLGGCRLRAGDERGKRANHCSPTCF